MVEKDGEHKNRLDLKLRGLVPFVDFARMMALRYGIKETNTLERLQMLATLGHMPEEMVRETVEAYEFIMQVRLAHQLKMIEAGIAPHNFVDPAQLSDLERMTLKACIRCHQSASDFCRKARLYGRVLMRLSLTR